jgi:hypothetical protein
MDMKKQFLLFILLLFIFFSVFSASTSKGDELRLSIEGQVELLAEFDSKIEYWNVFTTKNSKPIQSYSRMVNTVYKMKNIYGISEWTIKKEEEGHHFVMEGTKEFGDTTLKVLLSGYKQENGFIIQQVKEVKGTVWKKNYKETLLKFFNEPSSKIFSNVVGEVNSSVNGGTKEIANRVNDLFNGKKVEELIEEDFISITGNTPKWKNFITAGEDKINYQLGVRKNAKDEIHITIGSPVITIEY